MQTITEGALAYYDGPDPFTLKRAKAHLGRCTNSRDPEYLEPEDVAKLYNVPVEYLIEEGLHDCKQIG